MWCSLAVVAATLVSGADAAPAAPASELAVQVRRLVRQLDAPALRDRERAQEELVKLGPPILDLLPKEPDQARPEVADRVRKIVEQIQRAASTAALAASTVTLQGKLPLSQVLAALEKQTGNKLLDARKEAGENVPDPEIEVAFEKTPFWQAVDRVADAAQMGVYLYGDEKAVKLTPLGRPQAPRTGRASYGGPMRFEALAVLARRDLRQANNDNLRLELEVAWEPRLTPISLEQKMSDLEAFDENDQPLPLQSRDAGLEMPVEAERVAKEFVVPLALPSRDVKRIARLKGKMTVLAPGKVETFRFADLEKAKNVEKRAAGVTVTLQGVRKTKKLWEVEVVVKFDDAGEALASHRNRASNNPAFLEAKDGKQVAYGSTEVSRQGANEVGMTYLFYLEEPLANYTFVYQTPGMIFSTAVEYELKEIELP